jgi:hypothetical protein
MVFHIRSSLVRWSSTLSIIQSKFELSLDFRANNWLSDSRGDDRHGRLFHTLQQY